MRQILAIMTVLAVVATGCMQLPEGAEEMVSDEELDLLEDAGFEIHYGQAPPWLPYAWEFDSLVIEHNDYTPSDESRSVPVHIFDFHETDDDDALSIDIYPEDEPSRQVSGYISGGDDCFTVYTEAEGTKGDCNYEGIEVFSGCSHGLAGLDGIDEFQWGLLISESDGTCEEITLEPDDVRIIENRGLADLAS